MPKYTRVHEPLDADTGAHARTLALPWDDRVKSRHVVMPPDGPAITIALPRGTVLRDGTVLATENGELLRILAAAQPLARVTAGSPLALLRAAYHLANRHVPAQLAADSLLIERDPVLERMLVQLGAQVEHVVAPFEPEAGAYGAHGHGDSQGRGHHAGDFDEVSATVGEQLSIAAHERGGGTQR
jgi:urease accessory protein